MAYHGFECYGRGHPVVLCLKLLLAPLLVGLSSLGACRFGASVGGLLASLPVVAGPILLLFALEHGVAFARESANQTLLGVVALAGFSVTYVWTARQSEHRAWPAVCFVAGACTYLLSAAALAQLAIPTLVNPLVAFGGILAGRLLLPRHFEADRPRGRRLSSHVALLLRMAAAASLVLVLTSLAGSLGPGSAGLLVPFPVASTVLVLATHVENGAGAAGRLLAGFLFGLLGFVAFLTVLTEALALGLLWGFGTALAVSLVVQGVVFALIRRLLPDPKTSGSPPP